MSKNKEQEAWKGKKGSGLMCAQRGQSRCPDRGSVSGRTWLSGDLTLVHDLFSQKLSSLFINLNHFPNHTIYYTWVWWRRWCYEAGCGAPR
jgi:hypothetical protein